MSNNIICNKCKNEFMIDQNDCIFYERINVPQPLNCPTCRQQQRILFRNFKTFYKRPSDKSGKMIISMYSPDVPFPVWDISEWWSDDWDAQSYAIDLDLSQPFIKQISKLANIVPRFAIMNSKSENCEYSNMVFESKNCYLNFGCVENENCDYGHIVWYSKDCIDNIYVNKSELCYECIDCLGSNKLLYSQECESCVDSMGLYDCRGCTNCIGCVGLRQQSYNIFNKPVSKEEYKEFINNYPLYDEASIMYILGKREELRKKIPTKCVYGSHNNNVTGDHIYNSHNVEQSFDIKIGENSKYCYTAGNIIESYDSSFNPNIKYGYQTLNSINSTNVIATHMVEDSSYVYYSKSCYNCTNCFGCFGLRNKQYYILNKKYDKDEYFRLISLIIENMKESGDWGNFFPIWMSPFGYNESIVSEYMPLSKSEALLQEFKWQDNIPKTIGQENCSIDDLPNNPDEYNEDELLSKILKCEFCDKNYHLISREIAFYKKMKLRIPTKCFNCRHGIRMNSRNPRILSLVRCYSCDKITQTTYPKSKHNQYRIYCEECYKKEIN